MRVAESPPSRPTLLVKFAEAITSAAGPGDRLCTSLGPSAMSDTALLEKLKRFRNDPSAARPADADALMSQCFTLLSTAKSLHQHWFCGEASESLREAATFLIRLHAYDSSAVPAWKEQCAKVIHGCCACNSSYQDAKFISRTTYVHFINYVTRLRTHEIIY